MTEVVKPLQLGEHVRRMRIARGWTIEALATKAGVSRRTVMRLELGRDGAATSWLAVLQALGVEARLVEVTTESRDTIGTIADLQRRTA